MFDAASAPRTDCAPRRSIATWAAGTGYRNQEGHRFLWTGWADETGSLRTFESITEGVQVTGRYIGGGLIVTES